MPAMWMRPQGSLLPLSRRTLCPVCGEEVVTPEWLTGGLVLVVLLGIVWACIPKGRP